MTQSLYRLFAVALLAMCVTYACSDDDEDEPSPTPTAASSPAVQPQPEPPQPLAAEETSPTDGVIEIAATGLLFVENNLAVPAGESVIIRVTNNDPAPHNIRIAGTDGRFETEDDAITAPETIEMNGVGELNFAPVIDGYYTFRCDFHPTTMGGRIVAGDPAGPPVTPQPTPSPTATPTPEGGTESPTQSE